MELQPMGWLVKGSVEHWFSCFISELGAKSAKQTSSIASDSFFNAPTMGTFPQQRE